MPGDSARRCEVARMTNELPALKKRSTLRRRKARSDPAFGSVPESRPLDRYLRLGAVNLDKPSGPTSHEVAAWVRDILKMERAGHSGTLDPKVSGVLPVMLEDSTRVVEALLQAGKEYICMMRLHHTMPRKRVIEVCSEFVGPLFQKPPLKSSVSRVLRIREIYYLNVLEIEGQRVLMQVGCQAGTYMRKLCYDMGLALGCGANMEELRRSRAGPFGEDASLVTLHQLKDAYEVWREGGDEAPLRRVVLPVERALAHLPKLEISDNAVDAICHGAPLAAPGLVSLETDIKVGDMVAVYTLKGEAVALAKAALSSKDMETIEKGLVASTERVIMEPGVYPRRWKMQRGAEVV